MDSRVVKLFFSVSDEQKLINYSLIELFMKWLDLFYVDAVICPFMWDLIKEYEERLSRKFARLKKFVVPNV